MYKLSATFRTSRFTPIHLNIGCRPILSPFISDVTLRHVISLFVSHCIRNNVSNSLALSLQQANDWVRQQKMPTICLQSLKHTHKFQKAAHTWLDLKQTKPTKLKVNEAKTNWHTTLRLTTETNSHNHTRQRHCQKGKMKWNETKRKAHIEYDKRKEASGKNWKVTLSVYGTF